MKRIMFLFALVAANVLTMLAQNSFVAVLNHNGELTTFYSSKALQYAHDAAFPGDIITLSAGQFHGIRITKPLTIRGAGMGLQGDSTVISGSIYYRIEEGNELHSVLEGVKFVDDLYIEIANSITFSKCKFKSASTSGNFNEDNAKDIQFINCIIKYDLLGYGEYKIVNSYINALKAGTDENTSHSVTIVNSILNHSISCYGEVRNTIIGPHNDWPGLQFSSNVMATNCVYIGERDCFEKCYGSDNQSLDKDAIVFKDNTNCWELTDENSAKWLGNDGTQIGIHGGGYPFDPITAAPQIKKFEVATKTTADGKLSVNIEVSAK